MCTRFVLHGNFGRETDIVREIMDSKRITYRFEVGADLQDSPTLMTPFGRFRGLNAIRMLLGEATIESVS